MLRNHREMGNLLFRFSLWEHGLKNIQNGIGSRALSLPVPYQNPSVQGVSGICSAFAGMAAGSLASSGGQSKLLLAAALSLAIITVTVALAMEETFDGVGWDKSGDKDKLGSTKKGAVAATAAGGEGGMLTVLR